MKLRLIVVIFFAAQMARAAEYQLFEENGKYGLKDTQGKVIITPAFEGLGWSDGNFSVIGQVTGYKVKEKWGLINLKAQRLTSADYIQLLPSGGDRVIVKKEIDPITAKMGCIDLKGSVTVPIKYDGIKILGLQAIVFTKTGSKFNYGVIDLNGNVVIPLNYKNIFPVGSLRYGVQNNENLTALFSEMGSRLTGFEIDSISTFKRDRAIIYQHNKQGIIHRDGTIEVAPQYREIIFDEQGAASARAMNQWMLLDESHKKSYAVDCDKLIPAPDGFMVETNQRVGILDNNFNTTVPVVYNRLYPSGSNLVVAKNGTKFGVIQTDNTVVIPFQFDSIAVSEKFVRVQEKLLGKPSWLLYDAFGIRKSERSYESISSFNGKFFQVRNYGLVGIMDRYGKENVHCVYDSILDHNEDQVLVKFHGHFGVIDFKENWLLPPQSFPVQLVDQYHYLQKQDSLNLFKTFDGELIYFTSNTLMADGGILKELLPDGSEKRINFQGVISRTTPAMVDEAEIVGAEHEGLRGIRRNGKYGFIDNRGRLRIANRYEAIGNFKDGLAPVKILGKWGFINVQDKIVINPSYEFVSSFSNEVAIVKRGKFGLINVEGELILETRYDSIYRINTGSFLLRNDNFFGLANQQGVVMIEPRFETLQDLGNGYVIISRDQKFGLLTSTGLSTIPMIYDQLTYIEHLNKYLAKSESPWLKVNLSYK